MKKIIIIGGRGNGTLALSIVEAINTEKKEWEILGFFNDFEKEIDGYPVIGKINFESTKKYLKQENVYFFYTLLSTKFNHKYLYRYTDLKIPKERFATLIHPTAFLEKSAKIGYGVFIHALSYVGLNVNISDHVLIFQQAIVGQNSNLENFSYVAPRVCLGARVHLKEGAYIGTSASILEDSTIGKWALIGIATVVLRSVDNYDKVVGNPARIIGTTK